MLGVAVRCGCWMWVLGMGVYIELYALTGYSYSTNHVSVYPLSLQV